MYKFSKSSIKRLDTVVPLLKEIFVKAIKNSPYDFGIPPYGGFRTAATQRMLYNDPKVKTYADGYNKKSKHQSGRAVDIFIAENGKANWDKTKLEKVARHIQQVAKTDFNVNLEWGGDWYSWQDNVHFQISKGELEKGVSKKKKK